MRKIAPFLVMLLLLSVTTDVTAKNKGPRAPREDDGFFKSTTVETPNTMTCVHKYNNLFLAISNWGFFGSEDGGQQDCETGGQAASGRFPGESEIEYLFQGALWIGAVVGDDTLVTVGADGWQWVNEMYPCAENHEPNLPLRCGIERRSFRRADPYYHEDAKSDMEYIAIYTDTLNDSRFTPKDWDGSPYIPIGLEITQHSYSWSVDYAGDFILLDFKIKNITHLTPNGSKTIEDLFLGIYSDGDVGYKPNDDKHTDDICGFLEHATAHPHTSCDLEEIALCAPIDLTYICDNDGDPVDGEFNYEESPTGLLGTRIMRAAGQDVKKVSFNWWTGHGQASLDWGPMREATWRDFGTGGFGTPEGNKNKYYMLSNGEHDYDQIYSDREFEGWLPPNKQVSADLADGGDTRFLLSFGPFDLPPDLDTFLQITVAYIAGERLHRDPFNINSLPGNPEEFYEGLNFDEVSLNSVWAAWVYDNPVLDTTVYCNFCTGVTEGDEEPVKYPLHGDGIPDFQAAVPPPSPPLRYNTEFGKVYLRWNGLESETFVDPFTSIMDFEGYRVYWGRLPRIDKMSRLESRDFADYKRYKYYSVGDSIFWRVDEPPLTLDSLDELYGIEGDDFVPENWLCQLNMGPGEGFQDLSDGSIYCFEPADYNQSIDGWLDGARDVPVVTGIRKVFATEIRERIIEPVLDTFDFEADTLMHDNLDKYWMWDIDPKTGDSTRYHKFWEYEYKIGNLLPSVPHYFSVTAFDFGEFKKDFGKESKIGALEGSPLDAVVELWAINDAATVLANYPDVNSDPVAGTGADEFEVKVYPNPYIGDGRYFDVNFEQITEGGSAQHARELHFVNLPPECTVRIFTLDGDMVKEIKHPGRDSEWDSKIYWNMRTRNNELVSSGIYLYSVESPYGNQVGKFVIIF